MNWDDDSIDDESNEGWFDYEYGAWWYFGEPSYISNVDEYHKMKLIKLLCKFNIKSALDVVTNDRW